MSDIIRVCLDLNVFVGDLLSKALGRSNTAHQTLVSYIQRGQAPLGPVQLVISQGMLDRLQQRLVDRVGLTPRTAGALIELIAAYAELGPSALGRIVPVGTGVIPLRDHEDRGVLETALAGPAHYLVTANWTDFMMKDVQELTPGRVAFYRELAILHPEEMVPVLSGRRAPPNRPPIRPPANADS